MPLKYSKASARLRQPCVDTCSTRVVAREHAQTRQSRLFFLKRLCLVLLALALACGSSPEVSGELDILPQFKIAPKAGVELSGTLNEMGRGTAILQILKLNGTNHPELLHNETLTDKTQFSVRTPPDLGPVSLLIFADKKGKGAASAYEGARLDLDIGSQSLGNLSLTIGDLETLGDLEPGRKWGAHPESVQHPSSVFKNHSDTDSGPSLPMTLLPLFLLGGFWFLRPGQWAGWHWRPRYDLPLALGMGLLIWWIGDTWIVDHYLEGGRALTSDFSRVCASLSTATQGHWEHWSPTSSRLSGVFVVPLIGPMGIMDALNLTASAGFVICVTSVVLWASALHSRLAGFAAGFVVLSLMPLTVISRTLNFYPITVGFFSLCLALAVMSMVRPSKGSILAGALGIGLVMLVDVRGLLFALPALLMVVLGAYRLKEVRLSLRAGLILAPLMGSWMLADLTYPGHPSSLEDQVMALNANLEAAQSENDEVHMPTSDFRWGASNPLLIPATLRQLSLNNRSLAPKTRDLPANVQGRDLYLWPWLMPILCTGLLAIWGIRKRRWHLAALGLSILPCAMILPTVALVEFHVRFLALVAPGVAVLLGIGFATLLRGTLSTGQEMPPKVLGPNPRWLPAGSRDFAGLLVLILLVVGVLPSWFSPDAANKRPVATGQIGQALEWAKKGDLRSQEGFADFVHLLGEEHTPEWSDCEVQLRKDFGAFNDGRQ